MDEFTDYEIIPSGYCGPAPVAPKDFIKNPLLGYVGIKACDGQALPESGTWINTIPGISLLSIDKIANSDQVTYLNLWTDCQNEAWLLFKIEFQNEISKCFELRAGCDYGAMIKANREILLAAWRYLLAYQLMQYRLYSDRLNRFTLLETEDAQNALTYYQAQYKDALTLSAKLVNYSACAKMKPTNNPRYVTWLP